MVKLAETTNVTLRRKLRKADGTEFYEVPAIGDGNCAFNAFALGLIAAIKQDHEIDADVLVAFIEVIKKDDNLEILKQRVALYHGQNSLLTGNQYSDLADKLDQFVNSIKNPDIRPQDFIHSVRNCTSQIDIAVLQVALAPALRELSCNAREAENNALANNIAPQREDGADAGNDDFFVLAKTFNFNVDVHQVTNKTTHEIQSQRNQEPIAPTKHTIRVLHTGNHWNLLLPPAEKAVFAQLPDLTAVPQVSANNAATKELTKESLLKEWQDASRSTSLPTNASPSQIANAGKADKFRRANELMAKLDASNSQFGKFFDELSEAVKENNNDAFKKTEKEIQKLITPSRSKL